MFPTYPKLHMETSVPVLGILQAEFNSGRVTYQHGYQQHQRHLYLRVWMLLSVDSFLDTLLPPWHWRISKCFMLFLSRLKKRIASSNDRPKPHDWLENDGSSLMSQYHCDSFGPCCPTETTMSNILALHWQ